MMKQDKVKREQRRVVRVNADMADMEVTSNWVGAVISGFWEWLEFWVNGDAGGMTLFVTQNFQSSQDELQTNSD